nr:MAG TPA: hypothetical protein [Caudoviricetes sp.]
MSKLLQQTFKSDSQEHSRRAQLFSIQPRTQN